MCGSRLITLLQAISCFSIFDARRISSLILTFHNKFMRVLKDQRALISVLVEQISAVLGASFSTCD